jgi:hypothetical protein
MKVPTLKQLKHRTLEAAAEEVVRVSTCATCRHSARGTAIDLRPQPPGRPPNPMRPGLEGGNYICARNGLTPAKVDPVTGFQALPSGPDCRDLNPDGACEHYQRGVQSSDVLLVILVVGTLFVLAPVFMMAFGWL